MEQEEEIGMVLARLSELKTRLTECTNLENQEEEESSIVEIRDAFEALEQQLSNLQALQQQQRYERESSLFQIDRSRKVLLNKLKEYKGGDDNEAIQEAMTFASGTLDHDYDDDGGLLLPPYPSLTINQLYVSSHLTSTYSKLNKTSMNGPEEHERTNDRPEPRRIKQVFTLLAKSVFTFVGVVSVLSLAGFKPTVNKKCSMGIKIQEMFQKKAQVDCPPGKVMVIEEGKPRCVVKERIEVPFDLEFSAPKINFGFG